VKIIYLAGGCFWGLQRYLNVIHGVLDTEVGYANGRIANPTYLQVCSHTTGFAETVRVVYDPDQTPLSFLLSLYYRAIDPTTVNRQGADVGDQYRTGIYYVDDTDLPIIQTSIDKLSPTLDKPVMIEVKPLDNYYPAEEYHQMYLVKNPDGYCHVTDGMCAYAQTARYSPPDSR